MLFCNCFTTDLSAVLSCCSEDVFSDFCDWFGVISDGVSSWNLGSFYRCFKVF